MKLTFPSHHFDEAVAAVCHGSASNEQARALNELLRNDAAARDEYIFRLELHARLASEPELFAAFAEASASPENVFQLQSQRKKATRHTTVFLALAACLALLAAGWWLLRIAHANGREGTTSKAVAMLNRVVDCRPRGQSLYRGKSHGSERQIREGF